MKQSIFRNLERFVEFCLAHRVKVVIVYTLLTLTMAGLAMGVQVKTVFADLLPSSHPYVKVHEEFQGQFGGSNVVSIMVEVEKGDIFDRAVLEKVRTITNELPLVDGVNPSTVISLASKKLKEIRASTDVIETRPVMWPSVPKTPQEMETLKT